MDRHSDSRRAIQMCGEIINLVGLQGYLVIALGISLHLWNSYLYALRNLAARLWREGESLLVSEPLTGAVTGFGSNVGIKLLLHTYTTSVLALIRGTVLILVSQDIRHHQADRNFGYKTLENTQLTGCITQYTAQSGSLLYSCLSVYAHQEFIESLTGTRRILQLCSATSLA